ncbi:phosphate ABC transporter substrate-binding/OmpA family protein [Jannaschia aquimarina]|nr:phosphate ABC transporter substrate-binding/OmpA family protein [Jannaschia aquimarina]
MIKRRKIQLAAMLTLSTALAAPVAAEMVTLQSKDGATHLRGELLSTQDGNYLLRTALGEVTISQDLAYCEGDGCPNPALQGFRVAGSRVLADELFPSLLAAFSGEQSGGQVLSLDANSKAYALFSGATEDETVFVTASDTRAGLDALYDNEATFALASRPARNREARRFAEAGRGELREEGQEHVIALDGLVLATHPENPVRAITEINAALAFGGVITDWRELGGRPGPINLYVRGNDTGTREVFDGLLMRPNGLSLAANVQVMDTDAEVAKAVARDPAGLGFTSFANVGEAASLEIEGVCGIRTPASEFTIQTEEYPLTRLLYLYQDNRRLPDTAREMLRFIESEAGQDIVEKVGFVNQEIGEISINEQGLRVASSIMANETPEDVFAMREMVSLLLNADRLTTTFRFETGSSRLTSRSQQDVMRLGRMLQSPEFANKELIFVGFTDSVGKADLNQALSVQRAETVRNVVLSRFPDLRSRVRTRAAGYGEVSPLGCNETDNGRRINRRVEVWVQDIAAGTDS